MINFIQAGEDGPVKIGKAKNPQARLSVLQTGSSDRLYIRAILDAPDEAEKHLHKALASAKMRGEWFSPSLETNCIMACALAGHLYSSEIVAAPVAPVVVPVVRATDGWFDRRGYMKDYMREWRKKKKEAKGG